MQFPKLLAPVAIVAALVAGLAACATSGPNKGDLNIISVEQEQQMGQQVHGQVEQEMQLVENEQAIAYLEDLGEELAKAAPDTPFEFEFHIVKDPAINAFATPGGHVYINTGLIEAAESKSELAAVVAHEMGHVVFRHGSEQLTKAYGLNMVTSLALGQNPGMLEQLVAQVGGSALMLKYGRDAEREADEMAVKTLYDANVDPYGIVQFFQELKKASSGGEPPKLLAWLSTHPLTDERIEDAKERIAELPEKDYPAGHRQFREFKELVTEKIALLKLRTVPHPLH